MSFLTEIESVFDDYDGRQLTEYYTNKIDILLKTIYDTNDGFEKLSLIAVGGYGRGELAPFSDIDIMFFSVDGSGTEKTREVLYKLWDAKIPISHCFRTPDDCLREADRDIKTRTSLLESRYISGDWDTYRYFCDYVYPRIIHAKKKNYIREKLREMRKRHADFGDTVFLLEPNVKEGEGCLRDVHNVLWLSKVISRADGIECLAKVLPAKDYKDFIKAYSFLLKLRFCLHLTCNRRNDILSFDLHESVSKRLGFGDSKKFLGPERFMRYFYLKANTIRETTKRIVMNYSRNYISLPVRFEKKRLSSRFYLIKSEISCAPLTSFRRNPEDVIEAFYHFSRTSRGFSRNLYSSIKNSLIFLDKRLGFSKGAVWYFFEILKGKKVYDTLKEMHATGVLGRFIPEFGAIRALVVYEPYHRYTVDEHTLIAIKNLEMLRDTSFESLRHFSNIFLSIQNIEVVYLSLLFHDIGKASGWHHKEEGYKKLKNIAERFNLDTKSRLAVEFLVRNHIIMAELALKREAEDMEVISQFADLVGNEENLKALYLITYADIAAVNPRFWSPWKEYLLRELYERTLGYLRGIRTDKDSFIKNMITMSSESDREGMREFLQTMPENYVISTPAMNVLHDYALAGKVKEKGYAVSINEKSDGTAEIILSAWDSPGLLSRLIGMISSLGINILKAKVYTGKNGYVIDKIRISDFRELKWEGIEEVIENKLENIIVDGQALDIECRRLDSIIVSGNRVACSTRRVAMSEIFIEIDNESSSDYSVLEFLAPDRFGLLYNAARLMHEKNIDIASANINTDAGIAQDVFYIRHMGQKLDPETLHLLLTSFLEMLKESS